MPDPFAYMPPDQGPVDPGPGRVLVACRRCPTKLTRQQFAPFRWVHEDDEIILIEGKPVSTTKYDHEPDLDVIDLSPDALHLQ